MSKTQIGLSLLKICLCRFYKNQQFFAASHPGQLIRSDSIESTQSEREFRKKYQAITHRMVHRKSSAVMYSRILERTFGNTCTIKRHSEAFFGRGVEGAGGAHWAIFVEKNAKNILDLMLQITYN